MRKYMRQFHLWMGLSLGGLFALLGLTGSALVFYTEIDTALHPEIHAGAAAAPDWDRALATVRRAFPEKQGPWRFEVTGKAGAIPARYYNPKETTGRDFAPMMVWLSPDGGTVLRRDFWGDYAMTWIYDLHYRLLLGEGGGTVLGFAGMALVLLLLSGLWAWSPRGSWAKALRFKGSAPQTRALRDMHKLAGLWSIAFLLILTVTGVMLELPNGSSRALAILVGPADTPSEPQSGRAAGAQIAVSQALLLARAEFPKARIAWIEVPGLGQGSFKIRMQGRGDPSRRFPHSYVWINQYSGAVLATVDAAQAGTNTLISNWLHPLHDGSIGGMPTRILAALAGLMPCLLFYTGWKRWRRRRCRADN